MAKHFVKDISANVSVELSNMEICTEYNKKNRGRDHKVFLILSSIGCTRTKQISE